jgi:hypothetical protein
MTKTSLEELLDFQSSSRLCEDLEKDLYVPSKSVAQPPMKLFLVR